MTLAIHSTNDGVSFDVRVAPRSSRTAIVGVHADALKVALTAAPVDGAANDALVALLADWLGIPRRNVSIARGATGKSKRIVAQGIDESAVRNRLSEL